MALARASGDAALKQYYEELALKFVQNVGANPTPTMPRRFLIGWYRDRTALSANDNHCRQNCRQECVCNPYCENYSGSVLADQFGTVFRTLIRVLARVCG